MQVNWATFSKMYNIWVSLSEMRDKKYWPFVTILMSRGQFTTTWTFSKSNGTPSAEAVYPKKGTDCAWKTHFSALTKSPFSNSLWSKKKKKIKLRWALFVTDTIIQSITSSEMCSLHLTHPSTHTLGAVSSRHCGVRGAVGGSVPCSRVSPQSWTIPGWLLPFCDLVLE